MSEKMVKIKKLRKELEIRDKLIKALVNVIADNKVNMPIQLIEFIEQLYGLHKKKEVDDGEKEKK